MSAQAAADRPTAIVGATLWDGTGSPAIPHAVVIVRGGRIACAGPRARCPIPAGAEQVDGTGRFLLPGLIDTHVHLLLRQDGITDTSIKADLHDLLARGVTTVRDMGNNPPRLLEAVDSAQPAPRVFAMQLVAGSRFFSPESERTEDGQFRNHAPASSGMRQLGWWPLLFAPSGNAEAIVLEARRGGAIGLKLYQDLDPDQIARLVRAAHAAGLPVWGHAWVQPSSVLEQSQAGQDGVVHAAGLSGELFSREARDSLRSSSALLQATADSATGESARRRAVIATLDSLAARGTYLEPTLRAEELGAIRARASRRPPSLPQRYALAATAFGIEATRQAIKRGVRLTAGTDHVAYGPTSERAQLNQELALFVDSLGLAPATALLAATRDAATALGSVGKDLGTIATGKMADLVLFSADPLADIRNLEKVEWVMKEGVIFKPDELRRPLGQAAQ
jgi:imidazolonepropionase-like amidohydrolase